MPVISNDLWVWGIGAGIKTNVLVARRLRAGSPSWPSRHEISSQHGAYFRHIGRNGIAALRFQNLRQEHLDIHRENLRLVYESGVDGFLSWSIDVTSSPRCLQSTATKL